MTRRTGRLLLQIIWGSGYFGHGEPSLDRCEASVGRDARASRGCLARSEVTVSLSRLSARRDASERHSEGPIHWCFGMLPHTVACQDRQYAFAEPVSLLEVWIPREDEMCDAEFGVFDE